MNNNIISSWQFNPECVSCPRIAGYLQKIRVEYPEYHAKPVPPFGDDDPELLIVGLGPGMHGANATGRPFTGDHAGILLYKTLYEYGYSNRPQSTSQNDGLKLLNCRITNAVKCLPPANKPTSSEISNCNGYLRQELTAIQGKLVILALGRIAHNAVLYALAIKQNRYLFGHNKAHTLPDNRYLVDSYHCSRYNTQTRRLTEQMFKDVFKNIKVIVNEKT